MATLTKKDLLEVIEDMPMDAKIYIDTPQLDNFEPAVSVAHYSGVNRIVIESC